jgi:phage tail sheath protein FI
MAETLISPGVLARENDSSFVSQGPITAGAAIIGPTVKGPVELPTAVTSYSQFEQIFGSSFQSGSPAQTYSYFTSIAAYNYFNNGGTSLLVARVVSGSYTSATASIANNVSGVGGNFASASFTVLSQYTASGAGQVFGGTIKINVPTNIPGETVNYWLQPSWGGWQEYDAGSNTGYVSMSLTPSIDEWGGKMANFINSSSVNGVTNEIYSSFSASYNTGTDVLTIFSRNSSSLLNGTTVRYGFALNSYNYAGASDSAFSASVSLGGGFAGVLSSAFTLETLSEGIIINSDSTQDSTGALASGSVDNIRYQIINSNSSSGTFDLLVRQGNDNTLEPTVLETWTNLSLDPFSTNYISKVIGDQYYTLQTDSGTGTKYLQLTGNYPNRSKYIRVESVIYTTPNYFQNNGTFNPAYTSSLPTNASGAFGGAVGTVKGGANFYNNVNSSNTQGLVGANYNDMISLLANQDDYKYNVLFTPGLYDAGYTSQVTQIITNTQNRGDAIYVIDPVAYGAGSITTVTAQAATRNTSYAAEYWPWCQVQDPATGQNVWVPASTVIAGVYAYNDSVSEPWFAPAGINRGGLSTVIRAERRLPQGDRDTLYSGKVNPIATFPGTGVVVYGQKTLQTRASALDRVNVRRLLISLKSYISQVAQNLVFEQNTAATRNNFLAQVNPYLESVQQRQGLYAFRVIMDDSNNTPTVIDQNQMVGQIYLQPTKTAEFIYLDFNITPTGATFPA